MVSHVIFGRAHTFSVLIGTIALFDVTLCFGSPVTLDFSGYMDTFIPSSNPLDMPIPVSLASPLPFTGTLTYNPNATAITTTMSMPSAPGGLPVETTTSNYLSAIASFSMAFNGSTYSPNFPQQIVVNSNTGSNSAQTTAFNIFFPPSPGNHTTPGTQISINLASPSPVLPISSLPASFPPLSSFSSNGVRLALEGTTPLGATYSGTLTNLTTVAPTHDPLAFPTQPSGANLSFLFPLQAAPGYTPKYQLITETGLNAYTLNGVLGGRSSDPTPPAYIDPFHADHSNTDPLYPGIKGYYSIDLKSLTPAEVVAAQPGVVVGVDFTPITDTKNPGPTVTVYHGAGIFTVYREITAVAQGLKVGDVVSAGQELGTYDPAVVAPHDPHFQIKYNASLVNLTAAQVAASPALVINQFGTGLSGNTANTPLQYASVGGLLMTQYQLFGPNGPLQPANLLVDQNGHVTESNNTSVKYATTTIAFTNWGTIDTQVAGTTAQLIKHSPAYLWQTVSIPEHAQFLTFDFLWSEPGSGDVLQLWFRNNLLWASTGTDFIGQDFISSGPVWLRQFAGETGQLLFELVPQGTSPAEVDIRELSFIATDVPEPATSAMMILGFCGLGVMAYRRKNAAQPVA